MTVSIFHDRSHFEGVSGEPLVRTSDAERTGSVIERMRFMDTCPVDKQPMGLLRYDLMTVYYFRRIPMCDVKRKKSSWKFVQADVNWSEVRRGQAECNYLLLAVYP